MSLDPLSKFDMKTRDLEEFLEEAKCTQEEMEEAGDLEERMQAAFEVEEAQRNLSAHLLSDPQEDPEPNEP